MRARNVRWVLAALAVSTGFYAGIRSASADEAYLCEGGRVVYVKFGDLERLKRTDACIAGFFGLTVDAAARQHMPVAAAPVASVPAKQSAISRSDATKPQPAAPLTLKTISDERVRAIEPQRSAALQPVTAHPSTDFRNVHVINATDVGTRVFRHAR